MHFADILGILNFTSGGF